MRIVSWNVNGIRAAMKKGFRDYLEQETPDVVCLQETKARPEQVDTAWAEALGYQHVWNCADKAGYSGTSIWTRIPIRQSVDGMGIDEHDCEGRMITASWDDFYLVNVYTPNSQRGLKRLDYRCQWDSDFLDYLKKLDHEKPVIVCGDLNCSHHEIDLANPKANRKNAGFTDQERAGMDRLEATGFVDSFRRFNDEPGQYTWWTYRSNARARNVGWRLDYFWVANRFMPQVVSATIRGEIFGSDHCPVEIEIDVKPSSQT